MGLSYTGRSCLETLSVTGYSRVPAPPAMMIPFLPCSATRGPSSRAILQLYPFPVRAGCNRRDPLWVVKVPLHCLPQPAWKTVPRNPPNLFPNLTAVDRVTAIVAGTVLNVGDQRFIVWTRPELFQQGADRSHHMNVGLLAGAADVVSLPNRAPLKYVMQRLAMVAHVKPVANLLTITVHRHGLPLDCVMDHERHQLFRELVRPVIVGAVGGEHRQPVGLVKGPYQMVGSGF